MNERSETCEDDAGDGGASKLRNPAAGAGVYFTPYPDLVLENCGSVHQIRRVHWELLHSGATAGYGTVHPTPVSAPVDSPSSLTLFPVLHSGFSFDFYLDPNSPWTNSVSLSP
ncbi:hypothetical protein L1887_24505 [Cichorium endivia]|nr:hypothetical protein L1887_24505 [Cichorium endivia]